MDRRNVSKALLASAAGVALLAETARAQTCTLPCYPRTQAEIDVGVTPTAAGLAYPPGDLRRYGADVTGGTDSHTAIDDACRCKGGGTGVVWHPGGTIRHDTTITVPNGITIAGGDRSQWVFNYTGSGTAWRYLNGPNSSGYALVNFCGIKITTANAGNSGTALELNAGGWSYFDVHDCWLAGSFKYGLILDAVELCFVHDNIIENSGPADPINVWIVNGPERSAGQSPGYSNVITIRDNQISGNGGYGLADDGGNAHTITGNNFNGHQSQAKFAGVQSLVLVGNSFESRLQTGTFNIAFTTLAVLGGLAKGICTNALVQGNTFAGNMSAGSCILTAASTHTGFHITGNYFEALYGRGPAIDVTYLGSSFAGYNYDHGFASMFHYGGVHNDADGNTLLPPQTGSAPILNLPGATYGDKRYPHLFYGGTGIGTTTAPSSAISGIARLFVDAADGDLKVMFSNGTVRTIAMD